MKHLRAIPAIAIFTLLALTGCAAEAPQAGQSSSDDSPSTADSKEVSADLDVKTIQSKMKNEGYDCELQDYTPPNMSEVIDCQGDGVQLIANKWKDLDQRTEWHEEKIPTLCDKLGYDHVWWATSGDWLILPPDNADPTMEAFHSVTKSLGFETHDTDCE